MQNCLRSAALCALALAAATSANARGHIMPLQTPSMGQRAESLLNTATTPHLNYYGGPIIANTKVVVVFWNSSVDSTTQSKIGGFYGAITQSQLWDWLNEYNTTGVAPTGGQGGTNQTLGHGSLEGTHTITPANSATTIDDSAIQTELINQIKAGHLPPPDANTYYAIHFPAGMKITMSGSASCQQFCAYHSTIAGSSFNTSFNVKYGILPDVGHDGCELGCGSGAVFDNTCSVSSHELVEATTDPDVGLSSTYGPPLGWYDPQGQDGEIGDICNGQQGTITVGGTTYTVQKEWSNVSGACITTNADGFRVTVSPGSQNLSAGSSVTYTVTTATVRGAPQNISFSTNGLPSGVTASFSPGSVAAGGSSTMTLTASSSATNGSADFQVVGTGPASSSTGPATVVVSGGSGGSGGCPSGEVDIGGVCIPGGCSTTGAGLAWPAALLALGAFAALRRRRS